MAALTTMTTSSHASGPAWLQAALADVEERVQALAVNVPDDSVSDSFAQRADNYYRKRPQLVALLHDLHNRYLYLANRYCLSLRRKHCLASFVSSDIHTDDDFDAAGSDAESFLSFQPVPLQLRRWLAAPCDVDMVLAEMVVASVERDLLAAEGADAERRKAESSRKIELQGSLVEVLEAERMVLLGENVSLGLRAASLEKEAQAVESELGFMRQRAAELAWALVQLRENQRMCLLGRKIEGLQAQVYGLELRNRELFLAIARREKEKREARAEVERLRRENRRAREMAESMRGRSWRSLWDRMRKLDWAPSSCAPHVKQ
ncbi:kinase-interacting family protein-like [Zingiber officinale]|nr:kinase-interacting family protein-like [Zingiber officinale]